MCRESEGDVGVVKAGFFKLIETAGVDAGAVLFGENSATSGRTSAA